MFTRHACLGFRDAQGAKVSRAVDRRFADAIGFKWANSKYPLVLSMELHDE